MAEKGQIESSQDEKPSAGWEKTDCPSVADDVDSVVSKGRSKPGQGLTANTPVNFGAGPGKSPRP